MSSKVVSRSGMASEFTADSHSSALSVAHLCAVVSRPENQPFLTTKPVADVDTSHIHLPSGSGQEEPMAHALEGSFEEDLLSKVELIPPPTEIVALLKKAERKEVTSALYIRCLQAYQEVAQLSNLSEEHTKWVTRATDGSAIDLYYHLCRSLLLYLQLIMQITESMSDALGDQTEKVLIFIEQALRSSMTEPDSVAIDDQGDAADSDDEDEDGAGSADSELGGNLDAQDVTRLGLMETAIHLLLATLQCRHISTLCILL